MAYMDEHEKSGSYIQFEEMNHSSTMVSFASTLILFDVSSVLICVAVLLSCVLLVQRMRRSRELPPGPVGIPILGVLPFLGSKPYLTIQKWWKRYGDVFSMKMGSRLVVVINGVEAIKECFIKKAENFNNRPDNYFKRLTRGTGLVFSEGEAWREHRRFAVTSLRNFGMGKVNLERKVREEVHFMLLELAKSDGKPIDPGLLLPKAMANNICSIIYGSRFEYDDEVFKANIEALDQSVRNQTLISMIQFLPSLEFLPKIMPVDAMLMKNVRMRDEYASEQLRLHKETFDPNNPRDLIDAYLVKMQSMRQRGEHSTMEEKHLHRMIQDLFIAGTETMSTTLRWACLIMALNPQIQEECQKIIDKVVGQSRPPEMSDRPKMPFVHAAVMECQRVGNVALFNVPREASEDTVVAGKFIPKGSWIFVNRWGLHASERYWKDPETFNPRRFLDENGKVFTPEAFLPFGTGPRSCIGESLARMGLFLFFVSFLQNFTLKVADDEPTPTLEPKFGMNMGPQQHRLCFIAR